MAFNLGNVREASYKEAIFILESSAIDGGRKDVVHEFVNSDKQVIEDLGLKRKTYNISAIIHGGNYERDKDSLIRVLEDGKKGTFVHPFIGNIENMVCRTFSVRETFDDFGVAHFNIVLAPSDDISAPVPAFTSVSEVSSQRLTVISAIEEAIEDFYVTSSSFTGSIESGIDKATNFINQFASSTNGFGGIQSSVNSLNSSIIDFSSSVSSLVQDPVNLASSLTTLFNNINNVYPSAVQTLEIMQSLFNFGEDDKEQLNISTAAINEINSNNDIFNYSINSYALANAYLNLAEADFNTVTEIERQEEILETQFDLITSSRDIPKKLRTLLTDLRSTTSEVISELKTTTPDLISIDVVSKTSIRKLEYLYYGENTRTDAIISINNIQKINFVEGTLDILNDNF